MQPSSATQTCQQQPGRARMPTNLFGRGRLQLKCQPQAPRLWVMAPATPWPMGRPVQCFTRQAAGLHLHCLRLSPDSTELISIQKYIRKWPGPWAGWQGRESGGGGGMVVRRVGRHPALVGRGEGQWTQARLCRPGSNGPEQTGQGVLVCGWQHWGTGARKPAPRPALSYCQALGLLPVKAAKQGMACVSH